MDDTAESFPLLSSNDLNLSDTKFKKEIASLHENFVMNSISISISICTISISYQYMKFIEIEESYDSSLIIMGILSSILHF